MEQPTKTILVIKNEIAGNVCEEERPKYSNIVLILDDILLGALSSARTVANNAEKTNRLRTGIKDPLVSHVLLHSHLQGMGFYCSDAMLNEYKISTPKREDGEFAWSPVTIKESSIPEMVEQGAYTSGMSLLIGGMIPSWPLFKILNTGKHEEEWHQLISQDITWKELWVLVDEFDARTEIENLGSTTQEIKGVQVEIDGIPPFLSEDGRKGIAQVLLKNTLPHFVNKRYGQGDLIYKGRADVLIHGEACRITFSINSVKPNLDLAAVDADLKIASQIETGVGLGIYDEKLGYSLADQLKTR